MIILESVRERDIDLLILEEWNVNKGFCEWLVNKIVRWPFEIVVAKAYHSVMQDNLGETDLFLEFETGDGKYAILIENKIDAIAQDQQGTRYRMRAANLKNKSLYKETYTCITAANHYLETNSEVREYQYSVSYEQILDWYASMGDPRSEYKAMVLRLAIDQERRGYFAKEDIQVTKFWHEYWEMLCERRPDVYMREPINIPEGSDWPVLSFTWMPAKWKLRHKWAKSVLDMETDLQEAEVWEILQKTRDEAMNISRTGKSISISIKVKKVDRKQPFNEQMEAMETALAALEKFSSLKDVILGRARERYMYKDCF